MVQRLMKDDLIMMIARIGEVLLSRDGRNEGARGLDI